MTHYTVHLMKQLESDVKCYEIVNLYIARRELRKCITILPLSLGGTDETATLVTMRDICMQYTFRTISINYYITRK